MCERMNNTTRGRLTVVGGVFLAGDKGLRVKKRTVGARADFVDDIGLEIDVQATRNMFPTAAVLIVAESQMAAKGGFDDLSRTSPKRTLRSQCRERRLSLQ